MRKTIKVSSSQMMIARSVIIGVLIMALLGDLGITSMSAFGLSAALGEMEDRSVSGVTVPLTQEQFVMSQMLGIDPKKFGTYTKYAPIVKRTQETSRYKTETFFYVTNKQGSLNPIGTRHTTYVNANSKEVFSTSWSFIRGAGDNEMMWKAVLPTVTVSYQAPSFGVGVQQLESHLPAQPIAILVSTSTSIADDQTVIALMKGVHAFADGSAVTPEMKQVMVRAKKQDDKAQGYCTSTTYLAQNIVPLAATSTTSMARSFTYDIVSILGDRAALEKYGASRVQGLTRYHVGADGLITSVTAEPIAAATYKITSLPRCSD